MSGERRWFAVRCKTGREFEAGDAFGRQGFEVWLPVEIKLARHARRLERKLRAFFPGYLFLHLAPEERRWTAIRSTRGAVGAVRFGNVYPPVPDEAIAALRALEDERGCIRAGDDPESPFRPGERVRMRAGVMSGMEGVFLARNGEERAFVLLDVLQRRVRAEAPLADLAAA